MPKRWRAAGGESVRLQQDVAALPEALTESLGDTDDERSGVVVPFGFDGEGRTLLCPACGGLASRTD